MLNLMRYFPELRRFPGSPEFDGTPVPDMRWIAGGSLLALFLGVGRFRAVPK
jgi:hypothetical protein